MWFRQMEFAWLFLLVFVVAWSREQNPGSYNVYQPPSVSNPLPPYNNYQYNHQNPLVGLGPRDFGDVCEPRPLHSPSDENKMCNVARGLYCNPYAQRCVCIVPDAIYRHGKCRAKVNKSCIGSDGGAVDCVYNAICNQLTQLCQCKAGLLSNAEGTACNSAFEAKSSPSVFVTVFISFFIAIRVLSCHQ